ncbi:MAG: preprotein translocase subunit SecG [Ignavibacteriales bacterium]
MLIAVKAIHIIVSILLIVTVLLQPGKGDDLGTIFGGSSQSIFGASGAVPFLTKITRVLAVVFIITSLSLGYFSAKGISSSVIEESGPPPKEQELVVPPQKKQPPIPPTSQSSPSPKVEQESTSQELSQTPKPQGQPRKGSK